MPAAGPSHAVRTAFWQGEAYGRHARRRVRELAGLAAGAPEGRVEDMGGPEVRTLEPLARAYLKATGRHRAVVNTPLWGAAYRGFRNGGHLTPQRATGTGTFEEYLARRYGSEQARAGSGRSRA